MDALNCQKATAKQIIAQDGDYILAVKDNQPTLAHDIEELFATAAQETPSSPADQASTVEKGHGRLEERDCAVIQDQDTCFTCAPHILPILPADDLYGDGRIGKRTGLNCIAWSR